MTKATQAATLPAQLNPISTAAPTSTPAHHTGAVPAHPAHVSHVTHVAHAAGTGTAHLALVGTPAHTDPLAHALHSAS